VAGSRPSDAAARVPMATTSSRSVGMAPRTPTALVGKRAATAQKRSGSMDRRSLVMRPASLRRVSTSETAEGDAPIRRAVGRMPTSGSGEARSAARRRRSPPFPRPARPVLVRSCEETVVRPCRSRWIRAAAPGGPDGRATPTHAHAPLGIERTLPERGDNADRSGCQVDGGHRTRRPKSSGRAHRLGWWPYPHPSVVGVRWRWRTA
jgi:hypothetical protein